jgi:hypothetical protein
VNLKEARIQKEDLCKVCIRPTLGPVLRKSEDSDRCKECTISGVFQLFISLGGRALSARRAQEFLWRKHRAESLINPSNCKAQEKWCKFA